MLSITMIALLVGFVAITWLGVRCSCLFTRILSANSIGTLVVLLIVLLGETQNTAFFLDIALIYALVNFVATIGLFRYLQRQRLGEER